MDERTYRERDADDNGLMRAPGIPTRTATVCSHREDADVVNLQPRDMMLIDRTTDRFTKKLNVYMVCIDSRTTPIRA